jgi:hypothetical protein
MRSQLYGLPQHVYSCLADRYWVFLDLKTDRYVCTERRYVDALAPWLYDYEPDIGYQTSEAPPEPTGTIISKFRSAGLLTTDAEGPKAFRATAATRPSAALVPPQVRKLTTPVCATWFLLAACEASFMLKRRSILFTVSDVQRMRGEQLTQVAFDYDKARDLVMSFNRFRQLIPRSYLCLFDSLTLLKLLARYRLFPRWVFGVRGEPFEAHCWVQADDVVLNDTVERVGTFTPIMVV